MKVSKIWSSNEISVDKNISLFVASFFIISAANATIKTVIPITIELFPYISLAFAVVLGIMLAFILFKIIERSLAPFIVVTILFVFIYAISLIQNYKEPQIILQYALWTFCVCIPIGICVYSIRNKEILYYTLLRSSYFITAILSLSFFSRYLDNTYNMFFSYSLILPLLLHVNEYIRNKKLIFLILSAYEIIIILLYGSRGALLCLVAYVVFKIVFGVERMQKKFNLIAAFVGIVILFELNFNKIGAFILNGLENAGFYSRTLSALFSGNITYLASRDVIWIKSIEMIKQKPLLGWGVGGEVRPLSVALISNKDITPHNGIIELMLNYGVPLGIVISMLLVLTVCIVFFVRNQYLRDLILMYYCCTIVPMMLIGRQYLTNPQFFVFIFLCLPTILSVISKKHKTRIVHASG